MLIKYAKIFALGMGAIMASGVPSGNVVMSSAGSKTRPAKYYRLASPAVVYDAKKKAVVLNCQSSPQLDSHVIGVGDKPQPVDETPAPVSYTHLTLPTN